MFKITVLILLITLLGIISGERRHSSRSVPVGADVKTVVNFDCPEEFGYYPHPNDCTQYYVCVFGGALLESCTGGLMYSHELQTCDWPRNVGCDGAELAVQLTPAVSSSSAPARTRGESRTRYAPPTPPPAQPAAIVTSRGQPRQLNHEQQQIIKQQQRLYAEAVETLPPAEEIENDRQQRVYRGQPSTVGQVQRDRDGIKHSNTISSYNGRNTDKIGVISFGTQQQQQPLQQQYSEVTDNKLQTNDLTEKRRRKRQTQLLSRHDHGTDTWIGLPSNRNVRINPAQLTLQPPPLRNSNVYHQSSHLQNNNNNNNNNHHNNFVPIKNNAPNRNNNNNDDYQTYNQYNNDNNRRYPTHTAVNTQPFASSKPRQNDDYRYYNNAPSNIDNPTSDPVRLYPSSTVNRFNPTSAPTKHEDNYSYYNAARATTFKPPSSNSNNNNKKLIENTNRPNPDYNYENQKFVQPATYNSFVQNQESSQESSKSVPSSSATKTTVNYDYKSSQTPKPEEAVDYNQSYDVDEEYNNAKAANNNETDDFYADYINNKHFSPPTSFYNTKNKYEDIENPFANPNFDFDRFLDKLRGTERKNNLQASESLATNQQVPQTTNIKFETSTALYTTLPQTQQITTNNNNYNNLINHNNLANHNLNNNVAIRNNHNIVPTISVNNDALNRKIHNINNAVMKKNKNIYNKLPQTPVKTSSQRNLYSSQIKPTVSDEYYYDDYEYPSADNNNNKGGKSSDKIYYDDANSAIIIDKNRVKPTKNGDLKYSVKYHRENAPKQQLKPSPPKPTINLNHREVLQSNLYPVQTKINNREKDSYLPVRHHYENNIATSTIATPKYLITTTTTSKPIYTLQKRPKLSTARPTATLTVSPRSSHRQRLTDTTTRNNDDDTKRQHSNVYHRVEQNNIASPPAPISTATATARALYNSSQYTNNNQYEPYYYEDDLELYRDDDYPQQYNNNNNNNNNNNAAAQQPQQQRAPQQVYRGTPQPTVKLAPTQEVPLKRGNTAYIPNNYNNNNNNNQDIYQQSTIADYNEDNSYNTQVEDQNNYRQLARQPSRGDRNDLNYVEEATTKRTTTTTTRKPTTTRTVTTTTTTLRPIPIKKSTVPRLPVNAVENKTQAHSIINNTLLNSPGKNPTLLLNNNNNTNNNNSPSYHSNPGQTEYISSSTTTTNKPIDMIPDSTLVRQSIQTVIVKKPAPFTFPRYLITTEKPAAFHFITKKSRSTSLVSTTPPLLNYHNNISSNSSSSISSISKNNNNYNINTTKHINNDQLLSAAENDKKFIIPTTYSPPKFFLKSILTNNNKPVGLIGSVNAYPKLYHFRRNELKNNDSNNNYNNRSHKTLKAVRKLINPIAVNHELSATLASFLAAADEDLNADDDNINDDDEIDDDNLSTINLQESKESTQAKVLYPSTTAAVANYLTNTEDVSDEISTTTKLPQSTTTTTRRTTTTSTTTTTTTTEKPLTDSYLDNGSDDNLNIDVVQEKKNIYTDNNNVGTKKNYTNTNYVQPKRFRNTIEVPPPEQVDFDDYKPKLEPDQLPDYKLKPPTKLIIANDTIVKSDVPQNTHLPARVSRVNTAIKSLIAFGGTRRQNIKCQDNQSKCNEQKQRTLTRGRGSAHYTNAAAAAGSVANNEVATVNRGTPRSRPTLKPSTSIVSKATEFIDIYKYPPTRPETIYPQPQPDKTAAKCRKDVCLLPDCSCGGKEIPADVPVEQVPQLVLLTFDDSVNDLNKGLYSDLFEKGRVNPNGCPISATFYVSHEWTDYSQVQNLYSDGHELASHTVSHSFGEQFSQKKWTREVAGQREILSAYGGVHLEDVRGMRAPFLSVGGNKMFKMLYDSNFTYDSSMPIYENKPPSWPYTLDYKLFHDCMIPPCPTRSYPGVWEVPMVMWQDLNGGRCSMGDACSNPPDSEGVVKMLTKNFDRHYTTNRAPFGLFYHAAWFTQPHHKEGFIKFLDNILAMKDVWLVTNWQAIQWVRDPTPTSRLGSFQPFQCDYSDRPKRCNNPKVCNLWHKSGVRYMRTCQPCPDIYPWTGNSGIRSSRIDNDIED